MRLRRREPSAADRLALVEGWVLPDGGSTATAIGNADSPWQATVDGRGLLTPGASATWSLDWWVHSVERWHLPSREGGTAVSQRLLDGAPVVETAMRVPGGQAVHRAWCAHHGGGEWAVVEVENRSRQPVAVAFAIRPLVTGAVGRIAELGFDAATATATVDGATALVLPRSPSRHAASTLQGGDVAAALLADGGAEGWGGDVRDPDGLAQAAFVLPLAHTARLRVAVPLPSPSPRRPRQVAVGDLPGAEQVARGWSVHAAPPGSLRAELPDVELANAVAASRAALLVRHDAELPAAAAASILRALDRWGHHRQVASALVVDPDRESAAASGPVLEALAEHWRLTRDTAFAEPLVGPAAKAAARLHRRRRRLDARSTVAGQLAAAELLDAAGQVDAAALARSRAGGNRPPAPPASPDPLDAAAPWAAPDPLATAAFLHAARDLLVTEVGRPDDPEHATLALAPRWPDAWLGQGLEVHDAPTWWGRLAYAVRWHGARPALLWQLEVHGTGGRPVHLTVPGLDPTWSTTEPAGEALLSPVEPAGGLPKVVAPLHGSGTSATDAPEGGTFG